MTVSIAKWTLEEYHQMVNSGLLDERHVELLNGEIIEMSPEGEAHASYSTDAGDYLKELLGDQVIIRQGKPITIPNSQSEPEPDIAVVQPFRVEYREHHPYPENIFWLIEFSHSSLAKDTEEKRKAYAAAGIQEYWVVNLRAMQLQVYRHPEAGDYRMKHTLKDGAIKPVAFPDVEVSVSRILGEDC